MASFPIRAIMAIVADTQSLVRGESVRNMYASSVSFRVLLFFFFKECFGLFCCYSLTVIYFKGTPSSPSLTDPSGCIFSVKLLNLYSIKLGSINNYLTMAENAFVYALVIRWDRSSPQPFLFIYFFVAQAIIWFQCKY